MKKNVLITFAALVLLIFFTSCPSPPAIMGSDSLMFNGRFLSQQIYNTGRDIYTFNTDGSYEHIGKHWNADTEAWEQDFGSRGTYEYNSDTYLMTLNNIEAWNWNDSNDWYTIANNYTDAEDLDSYSVINYMTVYFTVNGMYTAYPLQADGSWGSESGYSHKESWGGVAEEYFSKSIRKWTISATEIMYTQDNQQKDWDDTTAISDYQREYGGTVRQTAPQGESWKAGATVTFYYGNDVNRDKVWEGDALSEWRDYSGTDTSNRTFVHLGDLILEVDFASSKNPGTL